MTGTITIINRHHYKDGLPENALYIGRGTPLGNPYKVEEQTGEDGAALDKDVARGQAMNLYRRDVWRQIVSKGTDPETRVSPKLWGALVALTARIYKGENIYLACSCVPKPCHGDTVKGAVNYLLTNYDQWVRPFLPPEPPPIFKVGDLITWTKCPSVIGMFATDRVTGVSECGKFIEFGYIRHPVPVTDCELVSKKH